MSESDSDNDMEIDKKMNKGKVEKENKSVAEVDEGLLAFKD